MLAWWLRTACPARPPAQRRGRRSIDTAAARIGFGGCLVLAGLTLTGAPAQASDAMRPGLYDVTTETGMPHLEEKLSYALRREQRCVGESEVSSLFWMLEDDSLRDCRLEKVGGTVGVATYDLICSGGQGTSGAARWQFEEGRLRGELNVTLGGKNMTLYQRVMATRLGECGAR